MATIKPTNSITGQVGVPAYVTGEVNKPIYTAEYEGKKTDSYGKGNSKQRNL